MKGKIVEDIVEIASENRQDVVKNQVQPVALNPLSFAPTINGRCYKNITR